MRRKTENLPVQINNTDLGVVGVDGKVIKSVAPPKKLSIEEIKRKAELRIERQEQLVS